MSTHTTVGVELGEARGAFTTGHELTEVDDVLAGSLEGQNDRVCWEWRP